MPDKVYKQRKSGPPVVVYGWCPSKNKAIAMQVDENGRLVIDPEDLDTRYLKLDGSNEQDLLPFSGIDAVIRDYVSYFGVRNKANTAWKSFVASAIYTGILDFPFWTIGYIKARSGKSDSIVHLQGYDLGALDYETVASVRSHATQPYFEILKAGNILAKDAIRDIGELALPFNQGYFGTMFCANFAKPSSMYVPSQLIGVPALAKIYYDGPSDEIRVYDGAAWNVH